MHRLVVRSSIPRSPSRVSLDGFFADQNGTNFQVTQSTAAQTYLHTNGGEGGLITDTYVDPHGYVVKILPTSPAGSALRRHGRPVRIRPGTLSCSKPSGRKPHHGGSGRYFLPLNSSSNWLPGPGFVRFHLSYHTGLTSRGRKQVEYFTTA
jgi:hypothetical protein